MAEEIPQVQGRSVASWRRYIILGGVALVAIAISLVVVLKKPATDSSGNTVSTKNSSTSNSTTSTRPTFERFQAKTSPTVNAVPTVNQPTLEQTREAIKQLQQQ